jgi:hypothetical protein
VRLIKRLFGRSDKIIQDPSHVPHIAKALAYCLGGRAIRHWNQTLDEWNTFEPEVIKNIRARSKEIDQTTWTCAAMEKIPANVDCRCMADGNIIMDRYTVLKWTFRDDPVSLIICGACGDRYREEMATARGKMHASVQVAAQDFVDAGHLDPQNNYVKGQIQRTREMCSKWEVVFPAACTMRRSRFVGVGQQGRKLMDAVPNRHLFVGGVCVHCGNGEDLVNQAKLQCDEQARAEFQELTRRGKATRVMPASTTRARR